MQKTLKRFFILLFAMVTLFSFPATALAASEAVLDISYSDGPNYHLKMFSFKPDPYFLPAPTYGYASYQIKDITTPNGQWFTPAGTTFRVNLLMKSRCTFRLSVFSSNGGVVYHEIITGEYVAIDMPTATQDTYYTVLITPYTDVYVTDYAYLYHPNGQTANFIL